MAEETLSTRRIFEGRAFNLRVDTVRTVNGRRSTREVVEHAPCIAAIAIDADGCILLVRQYRQALGKELLEIPAGGIDAGEDPPEAVVREMQEETGYRPQQVTRLCGFYSSPGFCTEYLHLFLVEDLVPGRLHAEDTAGIEVVPVPLAQVPALISSGEVQDAKSIAGLLYYLEYLKNRK
jgi:ADP-ribose pyrophosphatase